MMLHFLNRIKRTIQKIEDSEARRRIDSIDWTKTILIYQPGKVASTTIYHELKRVHPGPVIHMHTLNDDQNIDDVKRAFSRLHELQALPRVKIITLIREPIGRNLSAFFQNLKKFNQIKFDGVPFSTEELWDLYMRSEKASFILNWFDLELFENFGIDAFGTPFPDCGFVRLENDKAEVLIMKHTLHDEEKSQLVSEFTGINNFTIGYQKNISSQKWYAPDLDRAKKNGFPNWYVRKMLESKYAQHFYKKDLVNLSQRWTMQEKR